jgi:hypothetical protein
MSLSNANINAGLGILAFANIFSYKETSEHVKHLTTSNNREDINELVLYKLGQGVSFGLALLAASYSKPFKNISYLTMTLPLAINMGTFASVYFSKNSRHHTYLKNVDQKSDQMLNIAFTAFSCSTLLLLGKQTTGNKFISLALASIPVIAKLAQTIFLVFKKPRPLQNINPQAPVNTNLRPQQNANVRPPQNPPARVTRIILLNPDQINQTNAAGVNTIHTLPQHSDLSFLINENRVREENTTPKRFPGTGYVLGKNGFHGIVEGDNK